VDVTQLGEFLHALTALMFANYVKMDRQVILRSWQLCLGLK